MTLTEIAKLRLVNQQINGTRCETAKGVLDWMGAMQAQDYAMAKWAVGLRLPGSTHEMVEAAIDRGEIIRTHALRPTWHFVSADNIYWMLELTGPQIKNSLRSRHEELELSESVFSRSHAVIENALAGNAHLTRDELLNRLEQAGIVLDDNRASHLLLRAELDGIICSGVTKNGKPTHALLENVVPARKLLPRDEALARLAGLYFTSHGPATVQDFVWWSGLSVGDARRALEMVKTDLISAEIESQICWFSDAPTAPIEAEETVHLLPAFDEFIISYKNRSASLTFEDHNKTVSNNGIFRPTIVVDGRVIGIWKRSVKKERVLIELEFFEKPEKTAMERIEEASAQFGRFLSRRAELRLES